MRGAELITPTIGINDAITVLESVARVIFLKAISASLFRLTLNAKACLPVGRDAASNALAFSDSSKAN